LEIVQNYEKSYVCDPFEELLFLGIRGLLHQESVLRGFQLKNFNRFRIIDDEYRFCRHSV